MLHVAVFVLACIVSIFGVGGGVFYVPLLIGFGLPFHQATNSSLLIILVTGLGAFIMYHRAGLVDWRLAVLLDPVKDLGAFLGGLSSLWFGESLLSVLFAVILIVGGFYMYRYHEEEDVGAKEVKVRLWTHRVKGRSYSMNLLVVLPFCLAAGYLSGLLGIGGGIFMVPLMVMVVRVPIKVAVATSSLMVCFTGAFGFAGGAIAGHFDPTTGLVLAVAAFFGALIGPWVTVRLDKEKLRKAFCVLMFLVALMMVVRGLA